MANSDNPVSSATTYNLEQEDIIRLSELADTHNDASAAFRLWQYYNFSNKDEQKKYTF